MSKSKLVTLFTFITLLVVATGHTVLRGSVHGAAKVDVATANRDLSQLLELRKSDPLTLKSDCAVMLPIEDLRDRLAAGATAACFQVAGGCDTSQIRDMFIPTANDSMVTIRVMIHVFCDNDSTNCVTTASQIDDQMSLVAAGFAPARINFSYQTLFHPDSLYSGSTYPGSTPNASYAVDPAHYLNVYVLGEYQTLGEGIPPWMSSSQAVPGGVTVPGWRLTPGSQLLAHEIGHALGLWHTHMGTFWVCDPPWVDCYEFADGSNGNEAGDFCLDTPPTPQNDQCTQPGGADCVGTPWGTTDTANIMGYSGRFDAVDCRDHFTDEQNGRMRCWTNSELVCWIDVEPGDVNCVPEINVIDVVFMIDYVYRNGKHMCPLHNVGDFDCNSLVDAVDVNILVAYVFQSGPHPECCLYD